MDHEEAIHMGAAERYLLGDLSVFEVEDYERHFFDCSQCSEELRMLAILREDARAVLLEQTPALAPAPAARPVVTEAEVTTAPVQSRWQRFFQLALIPAMAAIVVALFAGYEYGSRNAATSPQAISAFPLYSASRGEATVIAPASDAKFYSLYVDKTWDQDYVSYRAEFRGDGGKGPEQFSMRVPPPAAGRAIYILAPAHALPAGNCVLVILGMDASGRETEAARYPFTLSFK
jgi:hypothetical protein